jgi:pimeloyl-ACP methyl ester carboxylesterase
MDVEALEEETSQMNDVEPASDPKSASPYVLPKNPRSSCPIGWQPCALRPVFWAFKDYGPNDGAPVPLRMFYPTLEGSPQNAQLLEGCGRYPAALFLHGHCTEGGVNGSVDQYLRWEQLGMVLAKSGYISVMPQILDVGSVTGDGPPLSMLDQLLIWLRSEWEHHHVLLPAPSTALIGHSYGGILAGRFAAEVGGVAALTTLHSGWQHDAPHLAGLLQTLTIPKLFIMGQEDPMSLLSQPFWNSLPLPSHRADFEQAGHWDYLPSSPTACGTRSACSFYPAAAFTILLMFLGRYLRPELATDLYDRIPDNLRPPTPLNLTVDQEFYAGGNWLREIDMMAAETECTLQLDQRIRVTTFVPHVVGLNPLQASRRILDAHLRPVVAGTGNKVVGQNPGGGHRAEVQSNVSLELGSGQFS